MKAEEKQHLINATQSGTQINTAPPPGWGYRHLLAVLAFFGFFNVYCLRVNLSVAMVSMVNSTTDDKNVSDGECLDLNSANETVKVGEFDWGTNKQGLILGSFFYGYIITQIPGGWLAEKYGGKYLFGFGVLGTAVLTLLTPVAARLSMGTLLAVRVIEGIGEGVTFPAMHAMWGKWGPLWERSKLAGFCYAGAQMGTVFSMPISGLLCDYGFAGGWPSVFYVFGTLACVWFVIWMCLVHSTPAEHPHISTEEREYIESGVGVKEDLATPWRAIFTSAPVWAICVAHFCNNWGFYTMLTTLPSYMKNVLKFKMSTNGFLSALPYLGCWIGQNISGVFADYLRSRGILSTTNTRKILTGSGLILPGICLICVQFAGCNPVSVVAILTLALTLGGLTMGGFQINHIDLSPNFAGVLMGISNSWATIPGFVGPAIVGVLTHEHDTRAQWQIVFYIAAGVYIAGGIIYMLLADGNEKPWNNPPKGLSFAHRENSPKLLRQPVEGIVSYKSVNSKPS